MQFKNLLDDKRAVSPVIGVILMVAITVILAAVIGTFVLGLGDQVQSTSPRASFGFGTGAVDVQEAGGGGSSTTVEVTTVSITHETGNSLEASNLNVLVNGNESYTMADSGYTLEPGFSGEVSAGDTITIVGATSASVNTGSSQFLYDNHGDDDAATGTLDVRDTTNSTNQANGIGLSTDDTVRVVWTSESGDSSSTLGKFTLP